MRNWKLRPGQRNSLVCSLPLGSCYRTFSNSSNSKVNRASLVNNSSMQYPRRHHPYRWRTRRTCPSPAFSTSSRQNGAATNENETNGKLSERRCGYVSGNSPDYSSTVLSVQARIALLEGERRSFENVKIDLLRRVKMMEYALRMERYDALSLAQGILSCRAHAVSSGRNNSPNRLLLPPYPLQNLRGVKRTIPQAKKAAAQTPHVVMVRSPPALLLTHGVPEGDRSVKLAGRSAACERKKNNAQQNSYDFDATAYGRCIHSTRKTGPLDNQ